MNAYYSTPERVARLDAEVRKWIGTPFRGASAVPGPLGGVDCVGLTAAVHAGAGACPEQTFRRVPLDWHLHHEFSAILDFFRRPEVHSRLQQIRGVENCRHGDLMTVRVGLCEHHLGTYLDDGLGRHLLHVTVGGTVQRWSIGAPGLAGRVASVWRILEEL